MTGFFCYFFRLKNGISNLKFLVIKIQKEKPPRTRDSFHHLTRTLNQTHNLR